MKPLQPVQSVAEAGDHGDQPREQFDFTRPYFNARTAAAYVCCKTVKAFYMWRRRKGIVPMGDGTFMRADLDRVKRQRKPRRVMSPRSIANLEHGRHHRPSRPASVMTEIGK